MRRTGADDGTYLHDYVIGGGGDGTFLHVEGVITDPCGDDGMEIRIFLKKLKFLCSARTHHHLSKQLIRKKKLWVDLHPEIMVVRANLPQFTSSEWSANKAASSGRIQNSPSMQCQVRSLKKSLL